MPAPVCPCPSRPGTGDGRRVATACRRWGTGGTPWAPSPSPCLNQPAKDLAPHLYHHSIRSLLYFTSHSTSSRSATMTCRLHQHYTPSMLLPRSIARAPCSAWLHPNPCACSRYPSSLGNKAQSELLLHRCPGHRHRRAQFPMNHTIPVAISFSFLAQPVRHGSRGLACPF